MLSAAPLADGRAEPPPVVAVRNLRRHYGAIKAVKDISFEVQEGEIFGLIGPDGAGKTTTFHILGGVLEASGGLALTLGRKPRDMRLQIGYLTQQFSLYPDLSLWENLRYVAGLKEVGGAVFKERAWYYLRLMNLDQFPDRLAGQLSGGMKQKLALCCALIARPRLLLLDEPTTGVDPVSRREFWDLLSNVARDGVTVAVATPYLDEAERCSRLILMHEGLVLEEGSPATLKENLGCHRLELRSGRLAVLERRLLSVGRGAQPVLKDVQTFGDRLDVLVTETAAGEALVRQLASEGRSGKSLDGVDEGGALALEIDVREPTLENVFVARLRHDEPEQVRLPFPFSPAVSTNQGSSDSSTRTGAADLVLPSFNAIEARGVCKKFGSFEAVKSVSLTVGYGEIYGLLGANGAGKTTTIKILCGLISPTSGRMALCGQASDLRREGLRQRLGYMSQKFTLYDDLTIKENLEFYCGVYCVPEKLKKERIAWVLRSSELEGQGGLLAGKLPGGWKQRLSFGAAVLHQPEVLFLDEPTSGVDPLARREMWKLIRDFARQGTAILVTTHFLEEAENCNNLGFMVAGSLVSEGAPSKIKEEQPGRLIELTLADLPSGYAFLKENLPPWRTSMFAHALHVVLDEPQKDLPLLRQKLSHAGHQILTERPLPFSLEDCFIGIVQRSTGNAL